MNLRLITRCIILPMAAVGLGAGPATKPAPATRPVEKLSEAEQVQFLQKNIEAQMQELQERMFRLAELTRKTEPTDSARLLLAVRRAREELILEEMKEVLEQLAQNNVDKAGANTAQVIVKLERLKELLLSNDLDLQLQLERLRALNAAIAKVDAAIREEKRQTSQTEAMAKAGTPSTQPAGSGLANAQKSQQQNRTATEQVQAAVDALGNPINAAAPTLGSAAAMMSAAEGALGSGQCTSAGGQQKQATAKLEEARNQLEAERQKLLAEIESQIKRQVLENLTAMLEKQKTIREANEALTSRLADGNREAVLRVKQLASAEVHISNLAEQTAALIDETEFSFALPPALRSISRRAILVTSDLKSGKGDGPVISAEIQIERDIADLLETFKASTNSSNGQSRCKGCKSDKNKLLAELKVIRLLQTRVNQETVEVDNHRRQLSELPQELKDRIGDVHDHQQSVHDTLGRLDAVLNGRDE